MAADFSGILAGWLATTMADPISLRFFLNRGLSGATFNDLLPPTLKTAVFGFIIGLVSSFQGMRTTGGTEGVGRSATSAVLLSSLFIILADVLLVRLIIVFFLVRSFHVPEIELKDLHKSFGAAEGTGRNRSDGRIGAKPSACSGRSGTGKSVLLKLLIGLQKPDSGLHLNRGP